MKQQQKDLKAKLGDYNELKDKVAISLNEKSMLDKEVNFLRFNLKEILNDQYPQLSPLKNSCIELRAARNHLDKEYSLIHRTHEETSNHIKAQNNEIFLLTKEIEEISERLLNEDIEIKTLLKSKQKIAKEINDSSKKRHDLIEENKKLLVECKFKNNLIKDSERTKGKINEDLVRIIDEVNGIKIEIGGNMSELKEGKETNLRLQNKLKDIEHLLNELRIEATYLKEQKEKQRSEYIRSSSRREKYNDEILEIEKQINVLKCQLEHECNYYKIQCDDIDKYQLDNKQMKELILILERKNNEIERDLKEKAFRNESGECKSAQF